MEPSREELLALVAAQARVIEGQAQRIEQLEALVAELQRRLGQNSRNSSRPPSSDGRWPDVGPHRVDPDREEADPVVRGIGHARAVAANLSTVDFEVAGGPPTAATEDLVRRLRADRPPGVDSWITGDAARLVDLKKVIAQGLPGAVTFAILAMLVLLFAMTGSVVVPLKAILLNVLSLAATVGIMATVFVRGWLSGVLHTLTVPGLDPFVTVIILAFAFGLSVDYEVFLLTRIREYVDNGVPNAEAVRRGLRNSGRIITSAALLMVLMFACFGSAQMGSIEELGIGLAVAVDATIVRCIVVPATMTMLGRWNWWSPTWLPGMRPASSPVQAELRDMRAR